jgi:flagellar FliJ protein
MNTKRLQPIQKVATRKQEAALGDFLASQRKLVEAQGRLDELCTYAAGFTKPGAQMSTAMLLNRQGFLEKLQAAIEFQRKQIATVQAEVEVERAEWVLASRDVRVLDKLSECYRAREHRAAERALDKEQDDRNAAAHGRIAGGASAPIKEKIS